MKELQRKWHIDVLHHSHTDIGYTARQELVCRQHADFLRQAVSILRRIDTGEMYEQQGFRWQCENYWQIENFLRFCSDRERNDLIRYVREGRIGLSAGYLNLTDLIDEAVLSEHLQLARDWADHIGVSMQSAMTADVNGYSAGLPDALSGIGVRFFYSALHTHHGMYPLFHNPAFFRWRGPQGGSILTFVGEHYHWGNVLGLCPHGTSSFMLQDDLLREIECGKRLSTDAENTENEELELAEIRITRYLSALEASGWPLDFIPVFVSGIISDNSPPNGRVAERVNRLNNRFNGQVRLEMTTLDRFFQKMENADVDIPEYTGDWTDWWADGIASTPEAVKLYRDAQRKRNLAVTLDPEGYFSDPGLKQSAGRNMMLFAEHTWGHSASVSDPYDSLVSEMNLKKTGYAVNASVEAGALLDGVLEHLGNRVAYPDRPHVFRITNPWDFPVTLPVSVPLLGWEYMDGCLPDTRPLTIQNCHTGETLPSQDGRGPRGRLAETVLTLRPGESAALKLAYAAPNRDMPPHTPGMCADAITDQAGIPALELPEYLDTPFFIIRTDEKKGIASIVEKRTGHELVNPDAETGAFSCLYEVTPSPGPQTSSRRQMGRRRQTVNTHRFAARPKWFQITGQGKVSITLRISFDLEGTDECLLDLKIGKLLPRMDARIRIKKKSCADPEGILLALPFVTDGDNETWIDKTGCILRPGIDQLPGTCEEFWCLQNGLVRKGKCFDLILGSPDVPLVSLGTDRRGPVRLCTGQDTELNRSEIRSRMMNNYWETNFAVDLGGWHEFRYSLTVAEPQSPETSLRLCAAINTGWPVLEL